MSASDDYRRDAAGNFSQAMRNATLRVMERLFPELPPEASELVLRVVEDHGLQAEGIEVILNSFRSDDDAKRLEEFWQSAEGGRILELMVELNLRSQIRMYQPHVELPPPDKAT